MQRGPEAARARAEGRLAPRRALVPAAALLGLWAATLPGLRDRLFPDSAAYAAIAEHYLAGRWEAAVNAYWSPLLSWLWAVPLSLGAEVGAAAAVGGLVSGGIALWALHRLLAPAALPPAAVVATLLTSVPLLVYAGSMATPDLLLAGLLLLVMARLRDPALLTSTRHAAATGLLAGAAYLAKLYALPVVLTSLPLLALLDRRCRRAPGRVLLRGYGRVLAAFALSVAAWAAVLTASTGAITVGTAGGVNTEVAAADSAGSPIYSEGLFPPPHPDADTAWEDPGALPPPPSAGGSDGQDAAPGAGTGLGEAVETRLRTVAANTARAVEEAWAWRFLLLLAAVGHAAALTCRHVAAAERRTAAALLLFAAVNTGGLLLVHVEERYLWGSVLALVPGTVVGLRALVRRSWRPVRPGVAAAAAVAALALGMGVPGVRAITAVWGEGAAVRDLAARMDDDLELSGVRVASDRAWAETTLLCLHAGCRYYGLTSPEAHEDWREQLARHGVERYLRWDDADLPGAAEDAREYPTQRWDGAPATVEVHPVPDLRSSARPPLPAAPRRRP